MRELQSRNQHVLDQALSNSDIPVRLRDAMRYSALSGGKRFRAMLVYAAGISVNAPMEKQLEALNKYASSIGLAFQVVDDILDIESSTEKLGKTSGADIALGKATYPSLIGLDGSKKMAQKLYQQAIASIATIRDNTSPVNDKELGNKTKLLSDLADLVVKHNH